jgi:hypothetical protein
VGNLVTNRITAGPKVDSRKVKVQELLDTGLNQIVDHA